LSALKQKQAKLVAEQQEIRYQISQNESAIRLDGDAARLGMVRVSPQKYIAGGNNPVALVRGEPGTTYRENRGWLDQLAIALGRPTEVQAKGR
jgi:hypothetical protein